ncbi:MAG: hypothetical protein ABI193_25260 [Minicystis sp.]
MTHQEPQAPVDEAERKLSLHPSKAPEIAAEIAGGAAAGAMAGAMAGPAGAAIGAVLGAAIGAIAGYAVDAGSEEAAIHDAVLDEEIGVFGGNLGEASPDQPAPSYQRLHLSSLGISSPEGEPNEGPIQNVDSGPVG